MSTGDALVVVMLGILLTVVGVFLVRLSTKNNETVLDSRIDGFIAGILATHLSLPQSEEVLAAIGSPDEHKEIAEKLRSVVLKSELHVQREGEGWNAVIEVWLVGADPEKFKKVTAKFEVHWDELPDDVRERLLRSGGPVSVPWDVCPKQRPA